METPGDASGSGAGDDILILHVDDEPDFADVAAAFLEREDDRIEVVTATSASEGLDLLADTEVDCVVSDYDMPGRNGLEFYESVRAEHGDVPFLLFTGKGSEEIASDAMSAGVTDYMQKASGTDQYQVLANRIRNVVSKHRAEQTMARERKRFRTLVEEATDVILVVGPDATITYAAPSSTAILGRSPETLLGTSGFDPIHPADRPRVMDRFADLVEDPGGSRTVEFRYERPDGSTIWVETRGRNLLHDDVIEGLVIYTRDTTERKERERELERYETIVEALGDPVYTVDTEARYAFVNDAFTSMTGYAEAELVGEHVSILLDEASIEAADECVRQLLSSSTNVSQMTYEITLETADGRHLVCEDNLSLLPLSDDGRYQGVAGVVRDVTDRKARERELEQYEAILDRMADVAFIVDEDWRLEYANERALSYADVSLSAIEGEPIVDLTRRMIADEEDADPFAEAIEAAFEADASAVDPVTVELELDLPTGRLIAEYFLSPLESDGEPKVVVTGRDVTERKEYERRLEGEDEHHDRP